MTDLDAVRLETRAERAVHRAAQSQARAAGPALNLRSANGRIRFADNAATAKLCLPDILIERKEDMEGWIFGRGKRAPLPMTASALFAERTDRGWKVHAAPCVETDVCEDGLFLGWAVTVQNDWLFSFNADVIIPLEKWLDDVLQISEAEYERLLEDVSCGDAVLKDNGSHHDFEAAYNAEDVLFAVIVDLSERLNACADRLEDGAHAGSVSDADLEGAASTYRSAECLLGATDWSFVKAGTPFDCVLKSLRQSFRRLQAGLIYEEEDRAGYE